MESRQLDLIRRSRFPRNSNGDSGVSLLQKLRPTRRLVDSEHGWLLAYDVTAWLSSLVVHMAALVYHARACRSSATFLRSLGGQSARNNNSHPLFIALVHILESATLKRGQDGRLSGAPS